MGFKSVIFMVLLVIVSSFVYKTYNDLTTPKPIPAIDVNEYWGPGLAKDYKENKELVLQEIRYAKEPIDNLRQQLNQTLHLQAPLEGVGYEYGVNSDTFKEFIKFWRDDYLPRWLSREVFFNSLPHYSTQIQG